MDPVTAIGLTAGALTTAAFVPQVAKVWRTRSTRDISLPTFVALVVGTGLWLVYGIATGDVPLIAANAISFAFVAAILVAKLVYK
jgi:MtN3 and saliva related transmembrane protein